MKKLVILVLGMVFILGSGGWLFAQPQATGYILSDIYYYLAEGTEPIWGGHSLKPQSGFPGEDIEGFSQSLEDVYYFMADLFAQCDLTTADLAGKGLTGKIYFSSDPENWGVVELVASPTPTPSPSPSSTPTPAPSVTPEWYTVYGPEGTDDVVKIGPYYVASWKEGSGCANNELKNWDDAMSWASELNWLERTDWQLPTSYDIANRICPAKNSLKSCNDGNYSKPYWSREERMTSQAYWAKLFNCTDSYGSKTSSYHVIVYR
jgi:hypothetical protein